MKLTWKLWICQSLPWCWTTIVSPVCSGLGPYTHTEGDRMVTSITTVLMRFKTDWAAQLQPDTIQAACQEAGYTSWRDRVLTPVTTIRLFLLQILRGNTACTHLPHLSGLRFSASAYSQARTKLPLDLFALLLTRLCTSAQPYVSGEGRWLGHRTFFWRWVRLLHA
jgi:hypothetical protein